MIKEVVFIKLYWEFPEQQQRMLTMKSRKYTLLVDATINLILGVILVFYSENLASFLGLPIVSNYFYPNILGSVFIGIAIALIIETSKTKSKLTTGLGLIGALTINMCGGLVLLMWLLFGDLVIPFKGKFLLWCLDVLLLIISTIELFQHYKKKD